METEEAKVIAEGIEKMAEKIANGMVAAAEKSGEKVADGIRDGFGATAKEIGKSLGGTRAELMLKLLTVPNGTEIPDPDTEKWKKCKKITDGLLKEFTSSE